MSIIPKVGRPKTQTSKPYIPKKDLKLTCAACTSLKSDREYYVSYNKIHASGKIPYCKECLRKMICDDKGNVTLDKLQSTLQLIDRPFIFDLYKISLEDTQDTFGNYMKNLCLKQNRELTWKDSVFRPQLNSELNYDNTTSNTIQNNNSKQSFNNEHLNNFQVTEKIIDRWGYGFQLEEYLNFERKYKKLTKGYKEKTELHSERLNTYITHKVKEEMATAKGDIAEAEKWAKLAQKDATDAKLNVSQLSKSDITGGIDLVPQLVEAIEQYSSLIPLLPKILAQPYDDADLIIWANVNYLRHLEEKPFIQYKNIWDFYDIMLEENFKQKGFSEEQIVEEKRKRNNVFRDLGEVYVEPLYENPDDFVEDGGDSDDII